MIAVSGDRPDRLAPGEPSLWRILRERIEASSIGSSSAPGGGGGGNNSIDLLLHAGGQSWMADAFEDAWELLKRRAMEPELCADGGWREAQEEAAERLREVSGIFILCKTCFVAFSVGGKTAVFVEKHGETSIHTGESCGPVG